MVKQSSDAKRALSCAHLAMGKDDESAAVGVAISHISERSDRGIALGRQFR